VGKVRAQHRIGVAADATFRVFSDFCRDLPAFANLPSGRLLVTRMSRCFEL
jgi:hypothetical protein